MQFRARRAGEVSIFRQSPCFLPVTRERDSRRLVWRDCLHHQEVGASGPGFPLLQSLDNSRQRGAASAPRVLVVEDDADVALLLTYNLEAEGYVVESVDRGDEVDLRLMKSVPDLVILDWMLPGASGLEICRRLRARESTRMLPVIIVKTAAADAVSVRR
jgi:CheY-like chemotaxis protein